MADGKRNQRGLGRGLSALMADVETGPARTEDGGQATGVQSIAIEKVVPNKDQPRRYFNDEDLAELAASIEERGIIQPLIVREKGSTYEIVAGERRWRAAQMARLHDVPVVVRDFSDTETLEVAIIENIQRADLNPMEEAQAYHQLMERFGHTQDQVAKGLGKSRSHIANLLRLRNLPESIQIWVREGKLSMGHARALLTADDPEGLAKLVISNGLSVREAERLSKAKPEKATTVAPPRDDKDADTKALEGDLSATLGMSVTVDHVPGGESGQVIIKYKTLDDLDELCRKLSS